jgi:hypothetical protein
MSSHLFTASLALPLFLASSMSVLFPPQLVDRLLTSYLCRFTALCAKSTSETSTRLSMTPMRARGVRLLFANPATAASHAPLISVLAHPTLDRNSPPEVVANFKRRVPPRLPKPRKRPDPMGDPSNGMISSRSSVGMSVPLTVPSTNPLAQNPGAFQRGRSRGFSAPGSFTPLGHVPQSSQWISPYQRQALPPLTVPSDSASHLSHSALYGPSSNHSNIPPITPTDDTPQSASFAGAGYGSNSQPYGSYTPASSIGTHPYAYSNTSDSSWNFPPINTSASHSNLSSLLNPSSGYGGRPTIQTSYGSHHQAYSSAPLGSTQSPVSVSPDSRPTTGYSVASSMSSLSYDHGSGEYDSRPSSSHHGRPITPARGPSPGLKHSPYPSGLSVRRERRHSHAVSPYPSPYDSMDGRPMTAPGNADSPPGSLPRGKGLVHMASTGSMNANDGYGFQPAQADFAYSAGANVPDSPERSSWMTQGQDPNGGHHSHSVRPSTSTSSLSGASQSSASATNTPPAVVEGGHYPEADINRCE